MTPNNAAQEDGFILPTVLAAIVLISFGLIYLAQQAHSLGAQALYTREKAIAAAATEAAVNIGIADIEQRSLDDRALADGSIHELSIGGEVIDLRVTDVAALIDLNCAPQPLLINLIREVADDPRRTDLVTAGLARWRASGGPTLPADSDNEAPGCGMRLPGRQFRDIGELLAVPGMDRDLYMRLAPYVTVYNRVGGLVPYLSPTAVLLAIPGYRQLGARALADGGQLADLVAQMNQTGRRFLADQIDIGYIVSAQTAPGSRLPYRTTAIVTRTSSVTTDWAIQRWVSGPASLFVSSGE